MFEATLIPAKSARSGGASRRAAFVRAACATGVTSGWRFARRYSIPILAYHGISSSNGGTWTPLRRQVSPDEFETHLRALSRYYQFISLDTAIGMLTAKLPRRSNCVVLTFDDGYRNNLTEALPILARYGAPAIILLPVANIESRRPLWFDRLDYAIQHLRGAPFSVRFQEREFHLEPDDRESLRRTFDGIRAYAKRALSDAELQSATTYLADELEACSGCKLAAVFETDPHCGLMSWDDIRSNCGGLITFGSHTVDHARLTRMDEREAREQLARSRDVLTAITGQECSAIAYPNGDWDHRIAHLAADCGYQAGLTSDEGLNGAGCNLLALRRIGIGPGLTGEEILFRTCGLSNSVSCVVNPAWRTRDGRHDRCSV